MSNDVSTAGDVIRFLRENYPMNSRGAIIKVRERGFFEQGDRIFFTPQVIDDYQLAKGLSRIKGRLGASYTVDLDHKQGSLFVPFPVGVARQQSKFGTGYQPILVDQKADKSYVNNGRLVQDLGPDPVLSELCADINGLINFVKTIKDFPKKEAVLRKLQSARNEL